MSAPSESQGKVRFGWPFLAITLLFVVLRAVIDGLTPVVNDNDWAFRDTVMDGPRLVALVLSILACRRYLLPGESGFHWRGFRLFIPVFALQWFVYFFALSQSAEPWDMSISNLLLVLVSSLLVSGWEEICFRGGLLPLLKRQYGTATAIFASTLAFALMHFQGHESHELFPIFVFGALFAWLFLRGVGLGWLIAGHALIDMLYLLGNGTYWLTELMVFGPISLLCALWLAWPVGKRFAWVPGVALIGLVTWLVGFESGGNLVGRWRCENDSRRCDAYYERLADQLWPANPPALQNWCKRQNDNSCYWHGVAELKLRKSQGQHGEDPINLLKTVRAEWHQGCDQGGCDRCCAGFQQSTSLPAGL